MRRGGVVACDVHVLPKLRRGVDADIDRDLTGRGQRDAGVVSRADRQRNIEHLAGGDISQQVDVFALRPINGAMDPVASPGD